MAVLSAGNNASAVHPTCVGQMPNTAVETGNPSGSSPRAWGRCSFLGCSFLGCSGSSPRAWGRSTPLIASAIGAASVHPHVRGADAPSPFRGAFCPPVHPHVRGADARHAHRSVDTGRFIPTCVGQIFFPPCRSASHALSQSVRGADEYGLEGARIVRPVHPHVRGADSKFRRRKNNYIRFIPTCVGQILRRDCMINSVSGSSPRAWGRSVSTIAAASAAIGSSPRAWGRCIGSMTLR